MEEKSEAFSGAFEGYLKKHKTVGGLTLFSGWTKRYFVLNLDTFTMIYYKNRKKKGKASPVPLLEMLQVNKPNSEGNEVQLSSGKEWEYEFELLTRSRNFLFNAYSWNDREVWYKALVQLMDYK